MENRCNKTCKGDCSSCPLKNQSKPLYPYRNPSISAIHPSNRMPRQRDVTMRVGWNGKIQTKDENGRWK